MPQKLSGLIRFVTQQLHMELDAFRQLMRFKRQRDASDHEWDQINAILAKALNKRIPTDSPAPFKPQDPRDFDGNLRTVLGNPPDFAAIFKGVNEVNNIYDAFALHGRADLKEAISDRVSDRLFLEMADFTAMMQIKVRIDGEWEEINRILEEARRKKNLSSSDSPFSPEDPTGFVTNLSNALGELTFPSDIEQITIDSADTLITIDSVDTLNEALLEVERYFFMSLERFAYVVSVAENAADTATEWEKVYAFLADAYTEKVVAAHRVELTAARAAENFAALAGAAIGDLASDQTVTDLIDNLKSLVTSDDSQRLEALRLKLEPPDRGSENNATETPLTEAEWDQLHRIAQIALRTRLGTPVAQKTEWLNLYPTADATTVSVALGIEADAETPRWKPFGRAEPLVHKGSPPPAEFGWAISSPLLALSQGERTITLILGFQPNQDDAQTVDEQAIKQALADDALRLQVSTEKGWVELRPQPPEFGTYHEQVGETAPAGKPLPSIKIELILAENIDPITPLPAEITQLDSPWPLLQVTLRQIWQPDEKQTDMGRFITLYQPFKALQLVCTRLSVDVSGLIPQQLQNDESALDPTKPFEPFGIQPAAGSRLYLGHPELVYHKLDSLDFVLEWMGVPDKLNEHYKNYPIAPNPPEAPDPPTAPDPEAELIISTKFNQGFTTQISLNDNRLELPVDTNAQLFHGPNASDSHMISISNLVDAIEAEGSTFPYTRTTELVTDDDLLAWNRYFLWELNTPDFQHDIYPDVASQKSVELAAAIANDQTVTAKEFQVKPPYTPKLKSLRLNYTSSAEISVEDYTAGSRFEQIYHIEPFGYREIDPEAGSDHVAFLPQYDFEGELYIGIQGATPPQHLALLLQMAEGSADPDLERVSVQWSYLSRNHWVSLDDGKVLADTTRGLINSGIINFSLPAAQPNTVLPPDLYWLRAALPRNTNSVCDVVALHTQAVAATFVDQGNAADHLQQPLPAESIPDLVETRPEVVDIRQPYTSFGGKMAEADRTFYTRISERLRHKQRALTTWDYEHIVLERFPELYKAKCLPATPKHPGQVTLIVIPNIRNQLPFNPFEPKVPADLIADIDSYLATYLPAFATVDVKNAHYVPVKVRVAVRFRPEFNPSHSQQVLNQEINHFLSPWAYEEGTDIVIGGRLYTNVLINFIEERPYVDYVAQIRLFSSEDGRTFSAVKPTSQEGYWVETDRTDGVLVAARTHVIDIISGESYEEESFEGINFMKIELDFTVGSERNG